MARRGGAGASKINSLLGDFTVSDKDAEAALARLTAEMGVSLESSAFGSSTSGVGGGEYDGDGADGPSADELAAVLHQAQSALQTSTSPASALHDLPPDADVPEAALPAHVTAAHAAASRILGAAPAPAKASAAAPAPAPAPVRATQPSAAPASAAPATTVPSSSAAAGALRGLPGDQQAEYDKWCKQIPLIESTITQLQSQIAAGTAAADAPDKLTFWSKQLEDTRKDVELANRGGVALFPKVAERRRQRLEQAAAARNAAAAAAATAGGGGGGAAAVAAPVAASSGAAAAPSAAAAAAAAAVAVRRAAPADPARVAAYTELRQACLEAHNRARTEYNELAAYHNSRKAGGGAAAEEQRAERLTRLRSLKEEVTRYSEWYKQVAAYMALPELPPVPAWHWSTVLDTVELMNEDIAEEAAQLVFGRLAIKPDAAKGGKREKAGTEVCVAYKLPFSSDPAIVYETPWRALDGEGAVDVSYTATPGLPRTKSMQGVFKRQYVYVEVRKRSAGFLGFGASVVVLAKGVLPLAPLLSTADITALVPLRAPETVMGCDGNTTNKADATVGYEGERGALQLTVRLRTPLREAATRTVERRVPLVSAWPHAPALAPAAAPPAPVAAPAAAVPGAHAAAAAVMPAAAPAAALPAAAAPSPAPAAAHYPTLAAMRIDVTAKGFDADSPLWSVGSNAHITAQMEATKAAIERIGAQVARMPADGSEDRRALVMQAALWDKRWDALEQAMQALVKGQDEGSITPQSYIENLKLMVARDTEMLAALRAVQSAAGTEDQKKNAAAAVAAVTARKAVLEAELKEILEIVAGQGAAE